MLMMLTVFAGSVKKGSADAHDAGRVCRLPKRRGQVTLMMLAMHAGFSRERAS